MRPEPPAWVSRWSSALQAGGIAAAVLACLAAAGCISATPCQRLAETGTAYADTIEELVGTAGTLAIDASSERLLQDDALTNTDIETLRRFDEEDTKRLAVLSRLSAHTRVMRRYFGLLGDLVAGRSGRGTVTALARVAAALDETGSALRDRTVVGDTAPAREAATVAAGFLGRALVRRELAARGELLGRALETHQEMLDALGRALRHDLDVTTSLRAQRVVIDPLLADEPIADADRWVEDRRSLLTAAPDLGAFDRAASAARKLRDAVAALGERRAALDILEGVLTDVETVQAQLVALRRDAP